MPNLLACIARPESIIPIGLAVKSRRFHIRTNLGLFRSFLPCRAWHAGKAKWEQTVRLLDIVVEPHKPVAGPPSSTGQLHHWSKRDLSSFFFSCLRNDYAWTIIVLRRFEMAVWRWPTPCILWRQRMMVDIL